MGCTIPIFEYNCEQHGKFERICDAKYDTQPCPKCQEESEKVEFSVPAKRNPEKGIQN